MRGSTSAGGPAACAASRPGADNNAATSAAHTLAVEGLIVIVTSCLGSAHLYVFEVVARGYARRLTERRVVEVNPGGRGVSVGKSHLSPLSDVEAAIRI